MYNLCDLLQLLDCVCGVVAYFVTGIYFDLKKYNVVNLTPFIILTHKTHDNLL